MILLTGQKVYQSRSAKLESDQSMSSYQPNSREVGEGPLLHGTSAQSSSEAQLMEKF